MSEDFRRMIDAIAKIPHLKSILERSICQIDKAEAAFRAAGVPLNESIFLTYVLVVGLAAVVDQMVEREEAPTSPKTPFEDPVLARAEVAYLKEEGRTSELICQLASQMSSDDFKAVFGWTRDPLFLLLKKHTDLGDKRAMLAARTFTIGSTVVSLHKLLHEIQDLKKEGKDERRERSQSTEGTDKPPEAGRSQGESETGSR